jgi:hypothetical protein
VKIRLIIERSGKNAKIQGKVIGKHLTIKKENRYLFPETKSYFTLVTNLGEIETHVIDKGNNHRIYMLGDWCRINNLHSGSQIAFTVLEPMKKYRLEIVK